MLAGVPFPFTLRFDPSAVDQQVQRAAIASIGQAHLQRSLTATQCAVVGHRPIQSGEPQQTSHEPGCLPERHTEQHLQGQTGLDRRIAELALATTLACWRWRPDHLGIKPDRQRSALLQRCVVRRPVLGLVLRRGPTAHAFQLSYWTPNVNPGRDLCNKAPDIPAFGPIGPQTVFNWLPLFVFAFVGFVLHGLFARTATAIKVIYFTLFYSRIMHAEAFVCIDTAYAEISKPAFSGPLV